MKQIFQIHYMPKAGYCVNNLPWSPKTKTN